MATGTGTWYGDTMAASSSGARKYIQITNTSFNTSTGVTTLTYNTGIQVDYGNFYGSHVTNSLASGGTETVLLYGTGTYGTHSGYTTTVAHNSYKHFYEWCGYTSSSTGGYIDSEVTLDWYPTLPTYTIAYNANGGSGAPASQTKTWGTNVTLSSTKPTRAGHTFLGWATSSTATSANYQPGATYSANAAVTLYAVWRINTFTVAYNANGGSGAPASQTKTYGTNLTLSSTKPTRSMHTFLRWNTAANGTGTNYSPGGTYSANAAATLYAQWQLSSWIVSYNANGGSGAPASQTKTAGTNLTLSSTKPTRTGYEFWHWNTNTANTGTTYNPGATYSTDATLTLYAIWNPVISFVGNGDGAVVPAKQVKTFGQSIKISETVPTRDLYVFEGYSTSASGSVQYKPGDTYSAESPLTLYAIWRLNYSEPVISNLTAARSDSKGSANTGAGCLKVEFDYKIDGTHAVKQEQPKSVVFTAKSGSDVSVEKTQTSFGSDKYSGHVSVVLVPDKNHPTMGPNKAISLTVALTDLKTTVTSTLTVPVPSDYFSPETTNYKVELVDKNGTPDLLGGYWKISFNVRRYYVGEVSGKCLENYKNVTVKASPAVLGGSSFETVKTIQDASATGISVILGNGSVKTAKPDGGVDVMIACRDPWNTHGENNYRLYDFEGYNRPFVSGIEAYRCSTSGVYEDDGTSAGVEVYWSITETASQKKPKSLVVKVLDSSNKVIASKSVDANSASGSPTKVVLTASGGLLNVEQRYSVVVELEDAYASGSKSAAIEIAFYTMDFLKGGHGIALGKPAIREGLEVDMPARFSELLEIAGRMDVPVYTYKGSAPVTPPAYPCLVVVTSEIPMGSGGLGTQQMSYVVTELWYYSTEEYTPWLIYSHDTHVTGVKGDAETEYRTGDVNITPDNIGPALAVADDGNNTPIVLRYSGDGLTSATWFCIWNGYSIRPMNAENMRRNLGCGPFRWNAITRGQTWSRIFTATPGNSLEGCSGILSLSCTRGNVVANATFAITASHSQQGRIVQITSNRYTSVRLRLVVNSSGGFYAEIYDTAQSIASGTNQTWHCAYTPLLTQTVTVYTAFTSGASIPSGYKAATDVTSTVASYLGLEAYPVGALYISYVSTSPASLFGGTWTQITGRVLRAANDVNTGGSDTHTLTAAQLPALSGSIKSRIMHYNEAWLWADWTGIISANTATFSSSYDNIYQYNGGSTNAHQVKISFGSGSSHNNLPAYQDVYVWRRTA